MDSIISKDSSNLVILLELSIPNHPVVTLHCFITKWIRTDKLIKPGQWVHYVYMMYPVHICLRFTLKSCSSCISFQADKSFWSCATQCFRPERCCKQALFKVPNSKVLYIKHPSKGTPVTVYWYALPSLGAIFFSCPNNYKCFKSFLSKEWKLKYNL